MNILTKIELDLYAANGCQNPGCTHEDHGRIYLNSRCHPGSHQEVRYDRGSGFLSIACGECQKEICRVKVADQ